MQMIHRLAAIGSIIDHHPIPISSNSLCFRNFFSSIQEMAQQRFLVLSTVRTQHGSNVSEYGDFSVPGVAQATEAILNLRNDKEMHRRLETQVT
jgi:hypothetical protein